MAYVATRRAQIAEAHARTVQATEWTRKTTEKRHLTETSNAQVTTAKLGRTEAQLALQDQALVTERARRAEAEQRAAQAAADLARVATVKQEPRGMVITLSGSVLFASNKSELLPAAQTRLNDVANALSRQEPTAQIVVEGHTDSQGTAGYNQDLSQRRAQAVRDYLVARGIASDRVTAQGFGFTRPIADNQSAEGRANNRRVEIVVSQR